MNNATLNYLRSHRADAPATIAAALAADYRTADQIPIADLLGYLPMTGLFQPYLAYQAGLLPDADKPLLPAFATVQYVLGLRTTLDTTDPAIATQVQTLLAGLQGAGILSAPDVAGFRALGGGYRYDRLTEAEVAAALVLEEQRDACAALVTQLQNYGARLLAPVWALQAQLTAGTPGDVPTAAEIIAAAGAP